MTDETEKEEPDTRGPAVVVTGSVLGGFKFHGPFETIDKAIKWWSKTIWGALKHDTTIVLLEKPVPVDEEHTP